MSGGCMAYAGNNINIDELLKAKPGGVIRCYNPRDISWLTPISYPANCDACGGPTMLAKNGRCHYCKGAL